MCRVTAVLSTLVLTADRAGWSADHVCGCQTRTTRRGDVVCPTAIRRELVWDTHKQAHAGAQRVLTKLQLRWYWPYIEHDVRRKVRQCETCQANKHGRPPNEVGRWKQNVEGPWQVEAVDLVRNVSMAPQGDVAKKATSISGSALIAPSPKAVATTSGTIHRSRSAKTPRGRGSIRRH